MAAFSQSRVPKDYYQAQKDSLDDYIRIKDRSERERKITRFIKAAFQNYPIHEASLRKQTILKIFAGKHFENKTSILLFLESLYQRQLQKFPESQKALMSAIDEAHKTDDHYLLYLYFSHLAFLQTDEGNAIDAVYSYGLAKNELRNMHDPYLEVLLNINISDIYYKIGLYIQSLSYLDKAQEISTLNRIKRRNIQSLINYNKAENYFRMHNYDSLKLYHNALFSPYNQSYKLHTYQKRTEYYMHLLRRDYKGAITIINSLQKDSLYVKSDLEPLRLADAYFSNGQIDSASRMVNYLLALPSMANHPEIKYHLYSVLGQIAQQKNDNNLAARNFELALEQSKQNVNNLTQVGNISSKIKIDEVQGLYYVNLVRYKRERMLLIFIVALAVLSIIVVAISYRSNRQKSHYKKLLFEAAKYELAVINSHEVRNHLSNILGLLDLMKDSNTNDEALMIQAYLKHSAAQLDASLRNVSQKLSN